MTTRMSNERVAQVVMRAVYRVAELAKLTNVTWHVMKRVLHGKGVLPSKVGRTVLIPASEILEKIPFLWESSPTS